jgi:hypothetical protein
VDKTIHYRGWSIVPVALPTSDHRWSASCDLQRVGADGLEVFEGATTQFVRDSEQEALAAATEEAARQIDNLIANPDIRLA